MKCIKLIISCFVLLLILAGCAYDRGLIIFNSVPITQNNAMHGKKNFSEGAKVYYLFIAPKKMSNDYIRVQVFKMTDLAPSGGNEVVRTKDYRLNQDERYYHTNYFTFYEKGRYVMQIFSHSDFNNPIGVNDFYIQ